MSLKMTEAAPAELQQLSVTMQSLVGTMQNLVGGGFSFFSPQSFEAMLAL